MMLRRSFLAALFSLATCNGGEEEMFCLNNESSKCLSDVARPSSESTSGFYLESIDGFMNNVYYPDYSSMEGYDECRLYDPMCTIWAVQGECESNPEFMNDECAPACDACANYVYSRQCPPDPSLNATNAIGSGDLHSIFERIVTEYHDCNPQVLFRPGMSNPAFDDSPWVLVLDDFLDEDECEELIRQGYALGFKESGITGEDNAADKEGNQWRTSQNTWCTADCYAHPKAQQVVRKIEKMTGIPDNNAEYLQLLKYETNEFYKNHHDQADDGVENYRPGPRILTVFLYLNDVEEGGGTRFTDLNATVMPKRGRVLIWPSVLNGDPTMTDVRTYHQALPVEKGRKYGANSWIHLRDYKTHDESGCA